VVRSYPPNWPPFSPRSTFERQASRWGKEQGYCVIDGQKVPIARTRVRSKAGGEVKLGSYEMFQRSGPLQAAVWDKMMRGLSTRNYGPVVKDFAKAYGVEKSAVSENFIEASREKLKELMERPLGQLKLCSVLIDGTPFKHRQMIVALGIGCDGRKTVLGLREGATENAAVVGSLLSELIERGLDFNTPRLYILDGARALSTAVKRHAGEAGFIQRVPGASLRYSILSQTSNATNGGVMTHKQTNGEPCSQSH
jgi:hypothetical protein